jgi:hypothetical protein
VGECYWFEWLNKDEMLNPKKVQQQHSLDYQCSRFKSYIVTDIKFWQSTSITLSTDYLKQEKTVFSHLVVASNLTASQVTL